jgi:hypothetical protein
MSQRGSGLLDAVAAAAIGALIASAATDTVAAIRSLGIVEQRERLLVTARNLLEQAVGMPCAALAPCPSDLACSMDRAIITAGPPLLARVRVSVEPVDEESRVQPVHMSTVRAELCS